jgi:carbamoyl-phosphate synthase small subunit
MRYLILEDGTKFEGKAFGADGDITEAEVVFCTSMTGFQEMLSDSKYKGKIVVATFPIVGVPGANSEDSISEDSPVGFIVREHCSEPSNFRSEGTLDEFMKKRSIVGLCGVDTRRLTRILRDNKSIKGKITDSK